MDAGESFPRQKARTRGFTLGAPRGFHVSPDGSRVTFLRSPAGDDPRTALWMFDAGAGEERLIASPQDLTAPERAENETVEERARRERLRETAEGIVAYATDRQTTIAAFALSGRLFVADLADGSVRELDVPGPVFDPRPSPTGEHIAFVHARALYAVRLADQTVTRLAGEPEPAVSWGMAEFVAAEEMNRQRGYWWSPAGDRILAARVDESPVLELFFRPPPSPPRLPALSATPWPVRPTPRCSST